MKSLIYPMFIHNRKIYPEDMDKLGNEPKLGNSSSECHWHYGHPYQFMKDDKKLADTVESILGAYLIVGNEKMAARLMLVLDFIHQEYFDRKRTNERSYLVCPEPHFWPEKGENGIKTVSESLPWPSNKEMASIERIESRLKTDKSNFTFADKALARLRPVFQRVTSVSGQPKLKILQSLCMPGYDPTCDNDRLEFLGDAVLDYVVAFEYYNNISAYTQAGVHWAKLGFQNYRRFKGLNFKPSVLVSQTLKVLFGSLTSI